MSRKTVIPQSRQFDERPINSVQEDFTAGMFRDIPGSKVPANGLADLKNFINKGAFLESRGGSRRWSNTTLPFLVGRTGYSLTKSGTTVTKTVGTNFSAGDVGNWIVYDDGANERISAYISATQVTVETSTAHAASTAAWLHGPVNCLFWHTNESKIVLQIDVRVFITDYAMASWTQAYTAYGSLTNQISVADELDQYVIIFNSGGIFKLDLHNTPYIYYKVNTPVPSVKITDVNKGDTTVYPYGRRYVYTMSRLTNATDPTANQTRTRQTAGVYIEQESGPVDPNGDSNYQDYGEVWRARPVGSSATNYAILTGDTLATPYDVPGGWSAITNGQFRVRINGQERNISCNFTNVASMAEVATKIQSGLRSFYSKVTCVYDTDHLVITNPVEGGLIENTAAGTPVGPGDAGTDIGDDAVMKCAASGAITTPDYAAISEIGILTTPMDGAVRVQHWTHYSIYVTLNVGPEGVDPINGEGNNTELYVWLNDVPIIKAYTMSRTLMAVTATAGTFSLADLGSTIKFADGTTAEIDAYADTDEVGVDVSGTIATMGAAIGADDAFTAYQSLANGNTTDSGYNVSRSNGSRNFAATDVGKTIHWADGSRSLVVAYVDANNLTVQEDALVASAGCAIGLMSRYYTDTTPDENLRSRIAGYALQNRFWSPLPEVNIGMIVPGFMFGAVRGDSFAYYSQVPSGFSYMSGYYHPAYQYTRFKDSIQAFGEFPDLLVIYCSNSTHSIATNNYDTVEVPEVGELVAVVSGQTIVDANIGVTDYGSIVDLDLGFQILVTSEPALRFFDGRKYGEKNLAEDCVQNDLERLARAYASAYDPDLGYFLWGLE